MADKDSPDPTAETAPHPKAKRLPKKFYEETLYRLQGELVQEGKGGDGDGDHDLEGVGACAKGGGGPGFRCTWASAPVDHDEGLSDSINLCRQDHMEVELHAPAIDADDRTNRTNRSREG